MPAHKLRSNKYFLVYKKLIKSFDQIAIYNCINDAHKCLDSQLQSIAHKYFHNFKQYKNRCPLFTKQQLSNIRDLINDPSLYISKPDKGNDVVILNRVDYVTKIENILCNHTKFEKINNCNKQKLVIKLKD